LAIVGIVALAFGLRWRAANLIPIDYDEDDYLLAAQHYAEALRAGDWNAVINYDYNYEHPPLVKLAYAVALLPLPPSPPIPEVSTSAPPARHLPEPDFHDARDVAIIFGTLEVFVLALLNPLAGLFLAIHTWQIKYTSEIMLEPLPAFASLLMVWAYIQWRRTATIEWKKGWGWLVLSSIGLGLTAGSKYVYGIAALAIVVDWVWGHFPSEGRGDFRNYKFLTPLIVWGVIGIAVFFAVDPHLWNDPVTRLVQSVAYHGGYAQSQHVKEAGYPIWQPLVWLAGPVPWHPGVFLFPFDLFVSLLALAGVRRLWQDSNKRVLALWLVLALAFLLWWTTKWPQYILILTAPLTMASAEGLKGSVLEPIMVWVKRWRDGRGKDLSTREAVPPGREGRRAIPWLLPGLIALGALAVYPMLYQVAMSLTDLNTISLRDGINGGVWRAVWRGLTLQEEAKPVDMFSDAPLTNKTVNFAGPGLYGWLFFGQGADILVFNVLFAGLAVTFQTVVGVSAAMLLDRPGVRFKALWRSIMILPWAIPEFVGALIWLRIFAPRYGWLPEGLPKGIPVPSISDDKNFAMFALVVAATWAGFPLIMLAASAGLKLIPRESLDAAAIDGAGRWARFRYVMWPLLWPLLLPAVLIRGILAFNQFYLLLVMNLNFPIVTFAEFSYLAVQFFGGLYAVSAAINIFTLIILVALLIWFNRWTKASEGVMYA